MSENAAAPPTDFPPVPPLRAGLGCRCPRCGRGRLYNGLLTVVDRCAVCGLDLSPHDSGDGPAVFVILILGAVGTIGAVGGGMDGIYVNLEVALKAAGM